MLQVNIMMDANLVLQIAQATAKMNLQGGGISELAPEILTFLGCAQGVLRMGLESIGGTQGTHKGDGFSACWQLGFCCFVLFFLPWFTIDLPFQKDLFTGTLFQGGLFSSCSKGVTGKAHMSPGIVKSSVLPWTHQRWIVSNSRHTFTYEPKPRLCGGRLDPFDFNLTNEQQPGGRVMGWRGVRVMDLLSQTVSGQAAPECSAFFYCSDCHKRVKKEYRFAHVPEVEVDKNRQKPIKSKKRQKGNQLLIKGINKRVSSGQTSQSPFDVFLPKPRWSLLTWGNRELYLSGQLSVLDKSGDFGCFQSWFSAKPGNTRMLIEVFLLVCSKLFDSFFQLMEVDEICPKGSFLKWVSI